MKSSLNNEGISKVMNTYNIYMVTHMLYTYTHIYVYVIQHEISPKYEGISKVMITYNMYIVLRI